MANKEVGVKEVLLGKGIFYKDNPDGPMRLLVTAEHFSQIGNLSETLNDIMDHTDFSGIDDQGGKPFVLDITAMMEDDAELLEGQNGNGDYIHYYEDVTIKNNSVTLSNLRFLDPNEVPDADKANMTELVHEIKSVPLKNWNPDTYQYLMQLIANEK